MKKNKMDTSQMIILQQYALQQMKGVLPIKEGLTKLVINLINQHLKKRV